MHSNRKRIVPVALFVILAAAGAYYFAGTFPKANGFTVSGTVEATELRLGSLQGGRVDAVNVDEGDAVQAGQVLLELHAGSSARASSSKEMIRSPIDGIVLYRSIEPGEVAGAGAPLITVIQPEDLTLTVYVPEDRYGQIELGQNYPVTVDSFPGETFTGTVSRIADQAEFTPRNVQTTDNRKTTVFAIRLDLTPAGGKLKPGMPADVHFPPAP